MRRHYGAIALVTALAAISATRTAQAATGFDSLSFKPASDHGYYLTVEQSQTLGQWGTAIGLTDEFSSDSMVLRAPPGADFHAIDKQMSLTLGAALGVLDWLNVGVTASGVPYQQFNTATGSDNGARMGDVVVNLKGRLLNNEKYPVGLALVPFVTLPTGNEQHFVGNGKVTGGGVLVLDTKRIAERVSFSVNAGGQVRENVALSSGTAVKDQFLYGAGMNIAVAEPVQLIAEADGWTNFSDFFEDGSRNLEADGAVRFFPGAKRKIFVTAGGGAGILKGPGAPDWRAFATVGYRNERKEEPAPPPPMAEPQEEVISTNKIHFRFNKWDILPSSYPVIDDILATIQNRSDVTGVRVEGHTDSVGSDAYNQGLSEKRANSVRTYLVSKGYPSEKITAVGMGEGSPISDNTTKAGRAENRRVEFHLQLAPGAKVKVQRKDSSPTYKEGDPVPEGSSGERRTR